MSTISAPAKPAMLRSAGSSSRTSGDYIARDVMGLESRRRLKSRCGAHYSTPQRFAPTTKVQRRKVICLGAAVVFALTAASKTISACRCAEPDSPAVAYRSADSVVVAKVVTLVPRPDIGGFTIGLWLSHAWKSDVSREVSITSGSSCNYPVEKGTEYLLFLTQNPDKTFTTGQCMGNRPSANAGKFIDWLDGKGKPARLIPPDCRHCHPGMSG